MEQKIDSIIDTIGQLVSSVTSLIEREQHSASAVMDQPVVNVCNSLEDFDALNGKLKESTKKRGELVRIHKFTVLNYNYNI
jgi:malate synthase